jgi:hypothetical protein
VLSDPEPPPLAPASPVELGLSPGSSVLDLEQAELDELLQLMTELGMATLRLDLDWSRIEQREGEFDWARTDHIIEAAAARGIDVHGLLVYTPTWARPAGTSDKHPPDDPHSFARFARGATERYRRMGVTSWEIWNEPNVEDFWEEGANPERYADLLKSTAEAIRDVDAEAIIVSGGLAPAQDRDRDLSPETFLARMLDVLPPAVIDAVAIHPYSYPAEPTDRSKDWNLFGRLPAIRDLVADSEGRPVPIWLTEFGAPTGTGDRAVSPGDQATIVLRSLQCIARLDWIGPLFLYNLQDRPDGDPSEPEDNFGLYTAASDPKESALAVREFQRIQPGTLIESPCEDWR